MGSGGFIAIERGPAGPGGRGGGRGGVRGGGGERQVVSVKKALERFVEEFEEALTNEEEVMARAKHKAENYGKGGREGGKGGRGMHLEKSCKGFLRFNHRHRPSALPLPSIPPSLVLFLPPLPLLPPS